MTAEPWPCHACGEPGARNIGTRGYCDEHLAALLDTFHSRRLHGFGTRAGLERPEHGPGYADLVCTACSATWVGRPGDPCVWCERSREALFAHQRELLLRPPDVDLDDAALENRMIARGERLRRGVEAGIVDQAAARRAWERAVRRAA